MNGEIKANVQLLPEEVELIERKRVQEKHFTHLNQEIKIFGDEESTRTFQKNIIDRTKNDIVKIIWRIGDMDLVFEGKYDELVGILDESIERVDRRIKPMIAKQRMSREHMERLDKELFDKIKKRMAAEKIHKGEEVKRLEGLQIRKKEK